MVIVGEVRRGLLIVLLVSQARHGFAAMVLVGEVRCGLLIVLLVSRCGMSLLR